MNLSKSTATTALFIALGLLTGGCKQTDTAIATPRKPSQSPVFHNSNADTLQPAAGTSSVDGPNISFLTTDHFGCLQINIANLASHPLLSQTPWSQIDASLSPLLGENNSKIMNIEHAWLVLDSEFFPIIPSSDEPTEQFPAVFILDFKNPIDRAQLTAANERRLTELTERASAEEDVPTSPALECVALTDHRLAIGAPAAVAKLSEGSSRNELVIALQQLPKSAMVNGAFTIRPIRPALRSVFDVISGFVPDAKKYAEIPNDLKKVTLSVDLDNKKEFLDFAIFIDNPELRRELFKIGDSAISDLGSSVGTGGLLPNDRADLLNLNQEALLTLQSPDVLTRLVAEIQQEKLLQLKIVDESVVMKMERPSLLPQLTDAMIQDVNRQNRLAERIDNLEKIAKALKQYEADFNALPSVQAHPTTAELPGQLSWRVAILPMLGYQELYDRFDFELAWDHPNNLAVAKDIPKEFQSLTSEQQTERNEQSNLHLFSGNGGLHEDQEASPKLEKITDRKIWSALVIEGANQTAQPWTQPNSIEVAPSELSSFGHENENAVLMIDGKFNVRAISRNTSNIQAVLSPQGGETLKRADFLKIK